jgi:folylpolyglutamate synthase/dihydropteroate synthase
MIEYFNKKLKKNPSERIGIVFGASKDKKVDEELAMLEEFADLIYLVKAYNHPRAMPIEQLTAGIGETKYPYKFSTFFITQGLVGNGEISKAMLYILA